MRTRGVAISLALCLGVLAALPALPASGKSISSSKLKALSNSINNAKHLTYVATYTSSTNGQTSTVTIAQAPHKALFETSSGIVVNTGKATYYCSSSSSSGNSGNSGSGNSGNSGSSSTSSTAKGSEQCISEGRTNPLLGLEAAFSSTAALNAFNQAKASGAVARVLGLKVSESSATIAGQPSTCISVTLHGQTAKYCVTKQGLLSYSGSSSAGYFKLTKYSAKPAASLFTLPAGATTVTLPSTPSVP
jgi:hypothetical protein